ncbi:MAG TPA: hypothetical protein DCS22_09065 [Flavobacteriaceae bacterium]|nr:hypothetical protein [Flavobacteriaceae bacterium]
MIKQVKLCFVTVLFLITGVTVNAQKRFEKRADEDTKNWRYEIDCVGTGKDGTSLIKVWSYSKKPQVAMEQAKKNAVHGVIFKGVPQGERGCVSQPALARNSNVEQEKQAYFNDFFAEGGKYMKFVNLTTDGAIGPGDRVKISRKEYKMGVIVSVNKALLRKELEDAGIVRGLSSGF